MASSKSFGGKYAQKDYEFPEEKHLNLKPRAKSETLNFFL